MGSGFRIPSSGFWVSGSKSSGFRIPGSGLRVAGFGLRDAGSGFRILGSKARYNRVLQGPHGREYIACITDINQYEHVGFDPKTTQPSLGQGLRFHPEVNRVLFSIEVADSGVRNSTKYQALSPHPTHRTHAAHTRSTGHSA